MTGKFEESKGSPQAPEKFEESKGPPQAPENFEERKGSPQAPDSFEERKRSLHALQNFVLSHGTGGPAGGYGHQLAVVAYRVGQLYCTCTKP